MEVTCPRWLNKEFMETALRSAGDPSVKVASCDVKSATGTGDNYSSDMFRVTVWVTGGDQAEAKSFFVKAAKETEVMELMISKGGIFDRELQTFTLVLPPLHRMLSDASSGNCQPFSPKFLYTVSGLPTCAIVMEDLTAQGFRMAERTTGLDLNHCLLVMKHIGRYHAASVVLHEKEPEHFQHFVESVHGNGALKFADKFFNTNASNVAKEVGKWPRYKDRFGDKLMKLAENAYESYGHSLERDEDEFNVLCHGDLTLNNMMFRYSEETGEVTDIRFVDFQLSHWTSPAIDLHYFLHTSVSHDLLDKDQVLVQEYYKSLTQTLSALGYRGLQPTLNQLNQQLQNRGSFAVLTCCLILPLIAVERGDKSDTDKLIKNEESINISEMYKAAMKKLLPIFEEKGWL